MTSNLTPQQMTALKTVLQERLAALAEEVRQDLLKSDADRAAMLEDRVRDLEDESVADLIVDLDNADTDRDLAEMREVEAALRRMSQGTYGRCMQCGGPIPHERLEANPAASRCQPCQRMHELTYAQGGSPSL